MKRRFGDGTQVIRLLIWVVTALVLSIGTLYVWAAGGDLLWEDELDLAGNADEARAIVAAQGRVYIAGSGIQPAPPVMSSRNFLVRAYDGKTGKPLWQDLFDVAGGFDAATAIAEETGRVYAAGTANGDFLVRAYDGKTGKPLWQDLFDFAGRFDSATAIGVDGKRIYVLGIGTVRDQRPGDQGNRVFLTRAYDGKTGKLVWQDVFDRTIQTQTSEAAAIAVDGRRVYATGNHNGKFLVRAYDGESGAFLWQDLLDNAQANAIEAERGLVFAVGGGHGFLVRAYSGNTGALLWHDSFTLAGGGSGSDLARAVSVGGGRVYVGGLSTNGIGPGDNQDFLVRAYDAENGAFLWQDNFHGIGNRTNIALATDLGGPVASPSVNVRGIRLYVAGFITSAAHNTDFVVHAYDGRNGGLLWRDIFDRAGGLDEALDLAVENGRVYAAGFVNADLNSNVFVRAYDAK